MSNTDSGWRKRQSALDKKAENARELGLDYEPSKTVMEMARESWIDVYGLGHDRISFVKALEAFAALIRADECKRYACVAMREAVLAERDACAEVCKKHADVYAGLEQNLTAKSAWAACIDNRDTIRARGTTPPTQPAPVRFKCAVIDEQHPNGIPLELWGNTTPPTVQPKQERNFCPRCGKRAGDYIHTCTPPQEKYTYGTPLLDAMTKDYLSPQRTWVGLTEDERINISYEANGNECVAVELTEAKLRSKNNAT